MATITGTKPFLTATETIDDDYKISRDRSYTLCVSLADGETIDTAMAIAPAVGSALLGFPNLWLARKVPRQISRKLVEIDLEFAPKPANAQEEPDFGTDPTTWAAKWLGSDSEIKQKVLYKDALGQAIQLSNGRLYSSPVYEFINVLVDRWRRYYHLVLPGSSPPGALTLQDYILYWNNSINDDEYRGKPAYTWLVSVSAAPVVVADYQLAEMTFTLRYNPLTWLETRIQHDSHYKDFFDDDKLKMFKDAENNPITGYLDDGGNDLTPGLPPRFKTYRGSYEERDFSELGF